MAHQFNNRLSGAVIAAAITVHRENGPGLDESVYELLLRAQLRASGIPHLYQHPLPLVYKGIHLDCGYRMDLLVEGELIVEAKSVEIIHPVHEAQLLTYLRLARKELGLLLNFDVPILTEGIRRRVWTPSEASSPPWEMSHDAKHEFEPLSGDILASAVEVHRQLGTGLLRSAYEECLCHELSLRGLHFKREQPLPLSFLDVEIPSATKVPLVVEGQIPVDCFSVIELQPLHTARLLSRVRQGQWRSGLLINFNARNLSKGVKRVVNS